MSIFNRAFLALVALVIVVLALGQWLQPVESAPGDIQSTRIVAYDGNIGGPRHLVKGELCGSPVIVSKVADYTVTSAAKSGTVFVAKTGAVIWTLPAPSAARAGVTFTFVNAVDADMSVVTATADTLITDGDLAADSVIFNTGAHKIGARVVLWCDGTSWYAFNVSSCTMTPVS